MAIYEVTIRYQIERESDAVLGGVTKSAQGAWKAIQAYYVNDPTVEGLEMSISTVRERH